MLKVSKVTVKTVKKEGKEDFVYSIFNLSSTIKLFGKEVETFSGKYLSLPGEYGDEVLEEEVDESLFNENPVVVKGKTYIWLEPK